MSEFVKFLSLSNPLKLSSHHFPVRLCQPWCINKDPTVWLDGDEPSPNYIFKNNISFKTHKFDQLRLGSGE